MTDLESFRRWTYEDDFPETGRVGWLKGELWAEMSHEPIFSHIAVKTEVARVLLGLAKSETCPFQ